MITPINQIPHVIQSKYIIPPTTSNNGNLIEIWNSELGIGNLG
jgi:hypothetical protein